MPLYIDVFGEVSKGPEETITYSPQETEIALAALIAARQSNQSDEAIDLEDKNVA